MSARVRERKDRRVPRWIRFPGPRALILFATLLLAGAAVARQNPPSPPNAGAVWSLAFSPDGQKLAVGTYRRVQVWDLQSRLPTANLNGCAGPVRSLAWTADGVRLAAGGGRAGQQGEVRIWSDAGAGQPVVIAEHSDVVESVAFSPGGETLFSAGDDEKVLAVAAATRKVLRTLADHTNRVVAVAVAPGGKLIATGSLDRTVKVWSGSDFKPLANIDFGGGQVLALAFLPAPGAGAALLAATGEDGSVRVYRLSETRSAAGAGVTSAVSQRFDGNRSPVYALAAAARSPLIAYGGAEKALYVAEGASGGRRQRLTGCTDVIYAVALNPDGSLVAAGCRDGRVLVWNVSGGKLAWDFAPSS